MKDKTEKLAIFKYKQLINSAQYFDRTPSGVLKQMVLNQGYRLRADLIKMLEENPGLSQKFNESETVKELMADTPDFKKFISAVLRNNKEIKRKDLEASFVSEEAAIEKAVGEVLADLKLISVRARKLEGENSFEVTVVSNLFAFLCWNIRLGAITRAINANPVGAAALQGFDLTFIPITSDKDDDLKKGV